HNWEELSLTPEQFLAYESRLKHIMDEESAKREAELRAQEAEKEGMKRGKKRGVEKGEEKGVKKGVEKGVKEGEKEGSRKTKEVKACIQHTKDIKPQRLSADADAIQYVIEIT